MAEGARHAVEPTAADATIPISAAAQLGAARQRANEERFRNLSVARGAVAIGGLGVFGWGLWLRRRGRESRHRTLRLGLLCLFALAAFASYYNFFRGHHPAGFKTSDVFHYYMGSKYFAELGYFELYHCALAARIEDGLLDRRDTPVVRDQHTLRIERPEVTQRGILGCPQRFEAERWDVFRRDVAFFRARIPTGSWETLLTDHGYNPTPVWAFVGGLFSKHVPADRDHFSLLIAIDPLLVVILLGVVLWAFGLEVACLTAIVWGTNPLWSYNWIGGAFLRNLWFVSAISGLALLRKEKLFASGALLAFATLLRVFPGVFIAGYLLHTARGYRTQGLRAPARRFVLGVAVASLILLAGGALGTGRGIAGYFEFREKMTALVAQPGNNKIGVSALASNLVWRATTFEVTNPEGRQVRLERPAPVSVAAVRGFHGLLVVAGLLAFWRALPRCRPWEAAALAFALLPLLTSPTSYYYPFVLAGTLLAWRRPWVGATVAVASLAWIVAGLALFLSPTRYLVYDGIAAALALTVLVGAAISAPSARESPSTA